MKYLITILIFSQNSFAQIETLSCEKLKKEYYSKINFLKEQKDLILSDSVISKVDFKNVITLKTNEYNVILNISDTVQRKRLMSERIEDLEFFINNASNKELRSTYFKGNVLDVSLYSNRIDSLNFINGLEKCTSCAIWRSVRFFVLKIENNKIDTLNCAIIKYTKIGFQGKELSKDEFEAFPCSKKNSISLNGNYGKNLVETFYNKKKYRREIKIGQGKSENDVYLLPLIMDEKYLVND